MGNLRAWSQTASGNASIAGGASTINFAEAQAPSTLNNSLREAIAQIRKQYINNQWDWREHSATCSVNSQTVFKISGDQTAAYVLNRAIRLTGGSTTLYAYITSSSYTSETTVTVNSTSGSLSNSMSIAALGTQFEAIPLTASNFLSSQSASVMIAAQITAGVFITSNSASTTFEALGKVKAINAQTGATYEFVLTDQGKFCEFSRASAVLVTIPSSASVAFPTGTRIDWIQTGTGTLSFTAGSGETITSYGSSKQAKGQYAAGSVVKVAVNLWRLIGNLN